MVVAFFNLLGGLSGILVETSIAANLGLSIRSDTFYVAYTIPYIITNLLTATGQFSLVPFFASLESSQDEKELWRGFSYVINILFLGWGRSRLWAWWHRHGLFTASLRGSPTKKMPSPRNSRAGSSSSSFPPGSEKCCGLFFSAGIISRSRRRQDSSATSLPSWSSFWDFTATAPYSIVIGYMAGYLLQLLILGVPVLVVFPVRYSLTLTRAVENPFATCAAPGRRN